MPILLVGLLFCSVESAEREIDSLDFGGFLKVRFDYAYKVKDPTPENPSAQNKWFYGWQLFNGQFQLGIDYPF